MASSTGPLPKAALYLTREKVSSVGRVNAQLHPFLWISFSHLITVAFVDLIFTYRYLVYISTLNYKITALVILGTTWFAPTRRAEVSIWEIVVATAKIKFSLERAYPRSYNQALTDQVKISFGISVKTTGTRQSSGGDFCHIYCR